MTPPLPAMSLEARAQQIAEVSTDAAFAGNPKARREGVKAAALNHLRAVATDPLDPDLT